MSKVYLIFLLWMGPALPLAAQSVSEIELRAAVQQQPQRAEALHQLADHLLVGLRTDWARRDPHASGSAFQAQADALQQRAQELVLLYERALDLDAGRLDAQVHLAEVYFVFLNQFQKAEHLLQDALRQEAHHPKASIALAEYQFFFKSEIPEALNRLEQALKVHPHQPGLVISLVDLRTRSSADPADYVQARSQVEAALRAHPEDENLRHMLGNLWLREADLTPQLDRSKAQTGLQIYTALFESNRDPDQALEVAQIARDMGDLSQAQEMIAAGLQAVPQHARLQMLKGDLALKAGEQALEARHFSPELQEAQRAYQSLLAQQQITHLLPGERVQLYYNLGLLSLIQAQQADGSETELQLAQAIDFFRQAQAIFDSLNMVNAPLQQELGKAFALQAQRLKQQGKQGLAREKHAEACALGLESSCAQLRQ